ncbi:hypothetical protein LTS18_014451, partial [Coniosporium uncinatum]
MPLQAGLKELLVDALPRDFAFTFYHISTPPTKCAPLFSPPQGVKSERTYCESHLLNVSITPTNGEKSEKVLVLAIEIFVYTTKRLTTLFVSKADSTGYLSLLSLPRAHASPLRSITSTFVSYLISHRQRPGVRFVVSLFARAQAQYLFPNSVENKRKHVSTDRELVRWWCRVLDPILQEHTPEQHNGEDAPNTDEDRQQTTSQAYLIVPGEDSTASFLPPNVRADPILRKRWKHGHPLREIAPYPTASPRCLIPHFPDDPKARFLDELDEELPTSTGQANDSPSKRGTGQWKSVKTLEQFWETMAFRQECSSGRLVGFIWIVLTPPNIMHDNDDDISSQQTDTAPSTPSRRRKLDESTSLLGQATQSRNEHHAARSKEVEK